VVTVIALLLVPIILVAITKMRESADAMSCSNNLKQLGLALHGYQDASGKLPPLVDQGEGAVSGRGLVSVFAALMPYIESTPRIYDPAQPVTHYNGHSSVGLPLRHNSGTPYTQYGGTVNWPFHTFLDPADHTASDRRDVPVTLPDGSVGYYATGSYAANGLLPWGTGKLSDASGKVVFGERAQVCVTASGDEVFNVWGLGFRSPHMPALGRYRPVDPTLPIQFLRHGVPCDPRALGTPHRSGFQAALANGSVRVFSERVDSAEFWRACRPEEVAGPP
jgi:hypothetical protein